MVRTPEPPVVRIDSPHHDARREGTAISLIILHYTGTRTAQEAASVYSGAVADAAGRISPHYMIDPDGTVYGFVPEARRAWHAGRSFWRGERDINSISIGIELVNAGHPGGCPAFPAAQIDALIALGGGIRARHRLPASAVLGHSDVAPGRKRDPGPAFDWRALAAHGLGVWPQESPHEEMDESAFHNALKLYGYDPHVTDEVRSEAFALHFVPEGGAERAKARLANLFRIEGLPWPPAAR